MSDEDTTLIEKFQEFADKYNEEHRTEASICPNCGYCPHCGRGYHTQPYSPYVSPPLTWPTTPYPNPWIVWCGDTGTSTTFTPTGSIS